MSIKSYKSWLGPGTIILFALLGCGEFILKLAHDWQVIDLLAESILRLVLFLTVLGTITYLCWRGDSTQSIRVMVLLLTLAVFGHLFLSVSNNISAWDHLALIGSRSSIRPVLKHFLFGCTMAFAFVLIYLLLCSASIACQRLEATVHDLKRTADDLHKRLMDVTVLNQVGSICNTAKSEDELVSRVTQMIAETFFPDNCGFLLLVGGDVWLCEPCPRRTIHRLTRYAHASRN